MERSAIIAACSRSIAPKGMKDIIRRAMDEVSKDGDFKIHFNQDSTIARKLSAHHYFEIWKVRFDMLSAKGIVVPGLEELIESLSILPQDSPLRLLIAEYQDWHINFWLDDSDAVVGCLFKEDERIKRS